MNPVLQTRHHTLRSLADSNGGVASAGATFGPLLSELRLLLVEDNPGDAELLVRMLHANGIARTQIQRAALLSEAVEQLRKQPVDAVILDLGLPDSLGIETLCVVRAEAPDAAVLVLTGLDDEETGLAAVAEGAEDYLVKGRVDGPALARLLRYAVERQRSRRQVRDSERFLLAAMDAFAAHIAVLDESGKILFVNRGWRVFAAWNGLEPGHASENTNYLAVCDAASGEEADMAKRFAGGIREVLDGKRVLFEMEYPCHSRDEQRWFVGRVTSFPGNGPPRVVVTHENITARRRAEEELQRLNRALRIQSACNEILVRATDETELLHQVCNVIMDIGGYGLVWVGFAGEDEAKLVRPAAWGTGAPKYMENIRVTWDESAHGRGPAGTAIRTGAPAFTRDTRSDPNFAPWRDAAVENGHLSVISLPLKSPDRVFGALLIYAGQANAFDDNEAKLLMEMAEDMAYGILALRTRTERDRVARDLAESEAKMALLSTAIERVPEAVVITGADGTIQYVNPAFEQITGYSRAEAIGKNPRLLQSGRQDNTFYRRLWDTVTRGDMWSGQFVNRRKDGNFYEEEATISPVLDEAGRTTHYVGIKRDISARLAAEQHQRQSQKLEALGTLAGGIAHDFNNILAVVLGYGQMVMQGLPQDDPLRGDMSQILAASDRAKNLVQQILSFSRKGEKDRHPLRLDLTIREAMEFLRPSIPSTITIRTDMDRTAPPILADPTQMHQVLMNLCTNAYHAMQDRGGELMLGLKPFRVDTRFAETHPGLVEGEYALLSVADTGQGIAPEILDRIFDPFFTTKAQGKGTGMGLATVHGIVHAHGGAVTVCSEPGKGTTFYVYLPGIEREVPDATSSDKPVQGGTERILIVDDEPALARVVGAMLKSLGYTTHFLSSSTEALAVFCAQPRQFDLIITDQTMPGLTGERMATGMLAVRPGMPIIIMTGFSEQMTPERAKEVGISGFLAKPAEPQQIAKLVREVLDRHQNSPSGDGEAFGTEAPAD